MNSPPTALAKYGLSIGLCTLGAACLGLAFVPIQYIGTTDPFTSKQEPISQPAPQAPILALAGIILIGLGGYIGYEASSTEEAEEPIDQPTPQQIAKTTAAAVESAVVQQIQTPTVVPEPPQTIIAPQPISYSPPTYTTVADSEIPEYEPPTSHDPHQEIHSLIHHPCVLIYGEQGSGKTSKMAWLVGQHIKLGHQVEIVDPLCKFRSWQPLKVWGRGYQYQDAENGIAKFTTIAQKRLRDRGTTNYEPLDDIHLFLALDEVTNYEDNIAPETMRELLSTCTQLLRQANMSICIVSHGETLACMGGRKAASGKSDVLKRQFKRLLCTAVRDPSTPGGLRCSGKATLKFMTGEQEIFRQIEIPHWMTAPNKDRDYTKFFPAAPSPDGLSPEEFKQKLDDNWK